jgi:hypothetical protein
MPFCLSGNGDPQAGTLEGWVDVVLGILLLQALQPALCYLVLPNLGRNLGRRALSTAPRPPGALCTMMEFIDCRVIRQEAISSLQYQAHGK